MGCGPSSPAAQVAPSTLPAPPRHAPASSSSSSSSSSAPPPLQSTGQGPAPALGTGSAVRKASTRTLLGAEDAMRAEVLHRANTAEDLQLPKAVRTLCEESAAFAAAARAGQAPSEGEGSDGGAALDLGHGNMNIQKGLEFPRLEAIPARVLRLSHLRSLNLKGNALVALPDALGGLKLLEELDASENKLLLGPSDVLFAALGASLRSLDLSENSIQVLAPGVGRLAQLRKLVLFKNELGALPAELAACTLLEDVNVFNNRLTELPAALGTSLAALREFNAGSNKLRSFLPAGVPAWTRVTRIALQMNKISALADLSPCAATLTQLQLGDNLLEAFPSFGAGGAPALTLLDLSTNAIAALPDAAALAGLAGVETLSLKKNRLAALPAALFRLPALVSLDASMNAALDSVDSAEELASLEREGGAPPAFAILLLMKTRVARLPVGLKACPKLQRVGLDSCPVDLAAEGAKELLWTLKETCEANGGWLRCAGTPLGVRPKAAAAAPSAAAAAPSDGGDSAASTAAASAPSGEETAY